MARAKKKISDLVKDKDFLSNARQYAYSRYGQTILSNQEVVDRFINEYRSMQVNEMDALGAKNFIQDTNDLDAVKSFSKAYLTVDRETEGPDTAGEYADAIADYARYGIAAPSTLLSLGAGKVAAAIGTKYLSKSIMNTAAKRLGIGFGAGAITEGGIAAASDYYATQAAEEALGPEVREERSVGEAAIAGAIGAAGGILTASPTFLSTLAAKKRGMDTIKESEAAKRALDIQTPAAEAADLSKLANSEDAIGAFVSKTDLTDEKLLKDPKNVGRVQSIEGDIAKVKYTYKDAAGKRQVNTEDVSLSNLKGLNNKQRDDYLTVYESTIGKDSLPKDLVEKGREIMREQGFSNEIAESVFSSRINKDVTNRVEKLVTDLVMEDPKLQRRVDPTLRISENISNIIRILDPEVLQQRLGEGFTKLNLSPEDFAAVYVADASFDGVGLAISKEFRQELQRNVIPDVSKIDSASKTIDKLNQKIYQDPRYAQMLEHQKHERAIEDAYQSGFAKFVKNWLGTIVSAPVTQVRDTLGLALQIPGMGLGRAIHNSYILPKKYEALGYKIDKKDLLKADTWSEFSKLMDSDEYLTIVRHFTEAGDSVSDAFFKAHNGLPAEMKPRTGKEGAFSKAMDVHGKMVDVANAYRRAIDERTTTSLYFSRLDELIIDSVNRGVITDPKIKGAMDVFKSANPDKYISPEMQKDAVSFALEKTYRRSIRELRKTEEAPGPLMFALEKIEEYANKYKVFRFGVAFPRFLGNLHHYVATRTYYVPYNAYKVLIRDRSKAKKAIPPGQAAKLREELGLISEKISKKQEQYKSLKIADRQSGEGLRLVEEMKELSAAKSDIDSKFGQVEKFYDDYDRFVKQSADFAVLIGSSYALASGLVDIPGVGSIEPTGDWNIFNVEGSEVDIRSIFPLSHTVWAATFLKRFAESGTQMRTEDLYNSWADLIGSSNVRGGSIQYMLNQINKVIDRDPGAQERVAQIIGAAFGNIVNGLVTPVRTVNDILQTYGSAESRVVPEKRLAKPLKEFEVGEAVGYLGFNDPQSIRAGTKLLNEFINEASKSTPFTFGVDKPEARIDPLTGDEMKTARAPLIKQFTGVLTQRQNRDVARELSNLGLNFYKDFKKGYYSNIPQYEVVFDTLLGSEVKTTLIPNIEGLEYKNLTFDQKKNRVKSYFKKVLPEINKRVKSNFPVLYRYHTLFKGVNKDNLNRAIRELRAKNPGIDIDYNYYGELGDASKFKITDPRVKEKAVKSLMTLEQIELLIKKYEDEPKIKTTQTLPGFLKGN